MFVYWINMLYVVKFNSNSIIIRETFMLNYKNVYDFNGLLKRLKYNLNLRICLILCYALKTGHKNKIWKFKYNCHLNDLTIHSILVFFFYKENLEISIFSLMAFIFITRKILELQVDDIYSWLHFIPLKYGNVGLTLVTLQIELYRIFFTVNYLFYHNSPNSS